MFQQLINACIAFIVGTAAIYNVHVPLLPYLGAWCIVDGGTIVATQKSEARRNAVLIHHVITSICCFLTMYEGYLYDPDGIISRRLCLLELSTVFVCLNNAFPSFNLTLLRNITFLLVRTTVSMAIMSGIATNYYLSTRHVALQVALVSLSLAWLCGPNIIGRNASVLCYYTPLITVMKHKPLLDANHILPFIAVLHMHDDYVINSLVPYLVFTIRRSSIELLSGIVIMFFYVVNGGPKQYSYGHRILWHTASACVITECIKGTLLI